MHAAIVMAFMPMVANAATLGKLTVNSGLGEPLNAEIELITAAKDDIASITANIAADDAYSLQGIQRSPLLKDVRLDFGRKNDGTVILRLTSKQPISSSSVDMLIVLNTLGGRALNEYTLYLPQTAPKPTQPTAAIAMAVVPQQPIASPPPIYREKESTPLPVRNQTSQPTPPSSSDVTLASPSAMTQPKQTMVTPSYVAPAPKYNVPETKKTGYITKSGDSLNGIARDIPLQEFSYQQLLVGLFKNNETAFYGNNMNRLRAGKMINTPVPSVIQAIPQHEAVQTISTQMQEYNAWLSGESTNKPSNMASGKIRRSGPIVTLSVEAKLPNETKDTSNSSENTKPTNSTESSASSTVINNTASAEAVAMSEDMTAKNLELAEAQARISALEKQIKDMQTLIAMKAQAEAAANNKNPLDDVLAKAKENPMVSGGILGSIGLLSVIGFIRRRKPSEYNSEGKMDAEIEQEMAGLTQPNTTELGRLGHDQL